MKQLQILIDELNIRVKLYNPYQFKTKGEMISDCRNFRLLERNILKTMSCAHPEHGRWEKGGKPTSHCGICLPCIIRRAAIKKANIEDSTVYRDMNFSSGKQAIFNLNVYQIGIQKYRNSLNNYLCVQKAGPLEESIKEYKQLYDRGMGEMINLLEDINE